MNYNGYEYFYIRNLQGDIVKLVDVSGNIVVSYSYDAWGNIISKTGGSLADANPYRYRGYRYDVETGWYYLNSRYYNPEIGRFINADGQIGSVGDILGHNMYAYAMNNPVMMVDPNGYMPTWMKVAFVAVVAAIVLAPEIVLVTAEGLTVGGSGVGTFLGLLGIGSVSASIAATDGAVIDDTIGGLGNSNHQNSDTTSNDLGKIAGSYGLYECIDASDAMANYLKNNNKKFEIITIRYPSYPGYIWSDSKGMNISKNGVHRGILYDGNVYDNVHPYGLPLDVWLNDFHGAGPRTVTRVPIG